MSELKHATVALLEQIDWQAVREESAQLLSRYVKFDTTNPPGREKEAVEFMADFLTGEGIACRVEESAPARANLIAEYGRGEETEIILLSHADVVPAVEKDWSHPPFSGAVADGYIWGRGTLDCKGLGIMEALALVLLKRAGINPSRKAQLIVVADEEAGGRYGAHYVTEELGEGRGAKYLLNEGGVGTDGVLGNLKAFNLCYGEKGPLWLRITSHGPPGHGSVPTPENANVRLVEALTAFHKRRPRFTVLDSHLKALREAAESMGGLKGVLLRILSTSKFLASLLPRFSSSHYLRAMYCNTAALTMLKSGYKENVIPERAEAVMDVRLLPGESAEAYVEELKAFLSRFGSFDVEIIAAHEPSCSTLEGPFLQAVKRVLSHLFPEAVFMPVLATGFTDSRYFRHHGVQAFGLIPALFTKEQIDSIHGIDEKISIRQMEDGTRTIFALLAELLLP